VEMGEVSRIHDLYGPQKGRKGYPSLVRP
jgi:hypothetical protein